MKIQASSNVEVTFTQTAEPGLIEPAKLKKPETGVRPVEDQDSTTKEDLDEVVSKMNETVQAYNYNLKFEVVDKTRIVISVIDTNTGEIIKQIPPKDLISAFKRMDGFFGLMVDKKV